MDVFWLNIDGEEVLLYRCIYAPVKSNMFIMVNGKEAIVIDPNDNEEGILLLQGKNVENVHLILTHEHRSYVRSTEDSRKISSE
jgi:glyoxylase-like metal-dependent hydrolase (beta-lactamase superfamily II)